MDFLRCNLTCQVLQLGICTLHALSCIFLTVDRYFVWLGSKLPCAVALEALKIKVSTMIRGALFAVKHISFVIILKMFRKEEMLSKYLERHFTHFMDVTWTKEN